MRFHFTNLQNKGLLLTLGRFGVADDTGTLERCAVVDVDVRAIVQTHLVAVAGAVDVIEGEHARHGPIRRLNRDANNTVVAKLLAHNCCLDVGNFHFKLSLSKQNIMP